METQQGQDISTIVQIKIEQMMRTEKGGLNIVSLFSLTPLQTSSSNAVLMHAFQCTDKIVNRFSPAIVFHAPDCIRHDKVTGLC